jgi:hypothetical protein
MRLFIPDFSLFKSAADGAPVEPVAPAEEEVTIDPAALQPIPEGAPLASPAVPAGAPPADIPLSLDPNTQTMPDGLAPEEKEDPIQALKAVLHGILDDDSEIDQADEVVLEEESADSVDDVEE